MADLREKVVYLLLNNDWESASMDNEECWELADRILSLVAEDRLRIASLEAECRDNEAWITKAKQDRRALERELDKAKGRLRGVVERCVDAEARVKELVGALRFARALEHNDDCLFCALKDKYLDAVLAKEESAPQVSLTDALRHVREHAHYGPETARIIAEALGEEMPECTCFNGYTSSVCPVHSGPAEEET